jgi:hypothetical protein
MRIRTFCLDCERSMELNANIKVGQRIRCPHCRVELEIINLEPLELDWIYERHDTRWDLSLLEENSADLGML